MTDADLNTLSDLINRGSFHGHDLCEKLNGPDNVWKAEKLLERAKDANLIEQGKFQPSREQRFFGIGGFTGSDLREPHASLVCYHWITKTTRWL